MFRALILAFIITFSALNSSAQTLGGQFKDWAFFTTKEDGKKVCYITSNPTRKTGTYKIRGDVYMIVTYRGQGSTPEVATDTGFTYKKGSNVSFVIDGKKQFTLLNSPQTPQMAWTKDEQTDRTVIDAMKNGGRVVVKGTSYKGTTAQDTYSLRGFSAAYNKMVAACN